MGDMIEDLLTNLLQSEDNGICIEVYPKNYYPGDFGAQTVTLSYGKIIPILYDSVPPYIPVQIPTPEDINSCLHATFILHNIWYPVLFNKFPYYLALICPVLSVQLNSVTSIITLT